MNLIVRAPLSEPPTESLPFRYVLSCAKINCEMDILLECEEGTEDLYWKDPNDPKLRNALSEFIPKERINDLLAIFPLKEKGLRLDTEIRAQRATIITEYIRLENQMHIINSIKNRLI